MNVHIIPLAVIRADTSAQPRALMVTDKIDEYTERMTEGDVFPPLVVFKEGVIYWLADGFHRYHAASGLGLAEFPCEVHEEFEGERGLRAAILYSCGVNAAHGIQRTNEDKRRAVLKLLEDPKWSGWADREIARQCRVSHEFVRKLRPAPSVTVNVDSDPASRTYRDRWGNESTMRTGNIGDRPRERVLHREERPERQWSPSDIAPAPVSPRASQIEQDNANGFLSSALWEIERQIDGLPSPREAVRRFPTHHHHTLSAEKLHALARWMSEFATAWAEIVEGEYHVAAE